MADELAREVKAVAASEGTTLRALIEEGLRWVLARRKRRGAFTLRDASVAGEGLQPGVVEGKWEQIRDLIYEGRGG
jgi:hypothetical protein